MPDTDTPYNLRYPAQTDVANVPSDISKLANDVVRELNGKVDTAGGITSAASLQKKIQVLPIAQAPPTGGANGDIIFYV